MKQQTKTIIITGATRGIGKSIASAMINNNVNLIVTGTSASHEPLFEVPENTRIKYVQLDLSDEASVAKFLAYVDSLERVDGLVNNAGINRINHLPEVTDEEFDAVMSVNLLSPFKLCRHVAKKMIASKSAGKIVNIASIWSVICKRGRVSYITSKSGMAGLTRGLATDLGEFNILVNSVSPGFVMTELTESSLSKDEIEQIAQQVPLNRLAQPDEIAHVVEFLMSDKNTYLTGQNIVVDGGFTHV